MGQSDMSQSSQLNYICCMCEQSDAVTLHEPFFGTANRKICVKYEIRFPVCMDCHNYCHNKNQTGGAQYGRNEEQAMFFCGLAGINYSVLKIAIERSKEVSPMLYAVKEYMSSFLSKWER